MQRNANTGDAAGAFLSALGTQISECVGYTDCFGLMELCFLWNLLLRGSVKRKCKFFLDLLFREKCGMASQKEQ